MGFLSPDIGVLGKRDNVPNEAVSFVRTTKPPASLPSKFDIYCELLVIRYYFKRS